MYATRRTSSAGQGGGFGLRAANACGGDNPYFQFCHGRASANVDNNQ